MHCWEQSHFLCPVILQLIFLFDTFASWSSLYASEKRVIWLSAGNWETAIYFFRSTCYQQIKLTAETLPSVYSHVWKRENEQHKRSVLGFMFLLGVQLGCVYVCICIDIHIYKGVFGVLFFFSLGQNFFPKHLVSLVCFPQKFTALTQAIFIYTALLFLSIYKIIISEKMQGIFIWRYKSLQFLGYYNMEISCQ